MIRRGGSKTKCAAGIARCEQARQGPLPTFTWVGTAGNDTLTGSAFGNNVFEGGAGNDTLNGRRGLRHLLQTAIAATWHA